MRYLYCCATGMIYYHDVYKNLKKVWHKYNRHILNKVNAS